MIVVPHCILLEASQICQSLYIPDCPIKFILTKCMPCDRPHTYALKIKVFHDAVWFIQCCRHSYSFIKYSRDPLKQM